MVFHDIFLLFEMTIANMTARFIFVALLAGILLFVALPAVCSTSDAPSAVLTDSTAEFFFPVEGAGSGWGANPRPGFNECTVELRLGDRLYWLQWSQSDGLRRPGSLSRLVAAGKASLMADVAVLHMRTAVLDTAISVSAAGDGIRMVLSDSLWHERIVGARLDSVSLHIDLTRGEDETGLIWTQRVRVERRIAASASRRARAEVLKWLESLLIPDTKWKPKVIDETLISVHFGHKLWLFEESGMQMSRAKIDLVLGPNFYGRVVPEDCRDEHCKEFALYGDRLFTVDGSLREFNLATGEELIHLRELSGRYARSYVNISISPCGQYLVVGADDSPGFAFLWDIAQKRAVADIGSITHPLWSRDGSLASSSSDSYDLRGRHFRRTPAARGSRFRLFDDKDIYTAGETWVERRPVVGGIEFAVSVQASRPEIIGLTDAGLYFREKDVLKRLNANTSEVETISNNVGDHRSSRIRLVYLFEGAN